MSGLAGEAFVAIWHDIAPEGIEEFLDWHHREHMPERLGIPGFRRGRRYLRVGGDGQAYFNLYEVDAFEVLVGQDYLGRLNAPTPWTRRAVAHFRQVTRGLCRVAGSQGIGQGGIAATLRIAATADGGERLRRHLLHEAIPALLDRTGILGAHLGFTDEAGSRLETAEKKARGSLTDIPPWVMVVEGISAERVAAAVAAAMPGPALAANGAAGPATTGIYRLEATRLKTGWSAG
ncbi:MAG: hypothetical protein FJX21_16475 [Alphaproteobacteria bacterium]|nr:hypothetical protein [Alphaproteobacteria bacterium]